MAASSSSYINIGDPNHPFAHITQQNHGSILFKNIPLEIRLMIYEFAVAVDEPVQPRQVAPRSNKFIWDGSIRYGNLPAGNGSGMKDEPLVVVSLSQACRSIYRELEDNPVFYRVNKFEFCFSPDLHAFLAAIRPKRLAMISSIRLLPWGLNGSCRDTWDGTHPVMYKAQDNRRQVPSYGHILALLTRCKDLKEVSLILLQDHYGDMYGVILGWDEVASGSHEAPAFINLPFFNVKMRIYPDGEELQLKEALRHPGFHQDDMSAPLLSAVSHGLEKRKKALAQKREEASAQKSKRDEERRKRGEEKDKSEEEGGNHPKWLKEVKWMEDLANETSINAALVAAPVDFTGGNRVAQDLHLVSDSVSSRTRSKDKFVDPVGVIHREVAKYTTDGQFTWEYDEVLGIRWNDSGDAELHISWAHPGKGPISSWESFFAIPRDGLGEYRILSFFQTTMSWGYKDLEAHLRRIRSIPSPLEIANLAGGFDQYIGKDTTYRQNGKIIHTLIRRRTRSWAHWAQRWDRYTARLENELNKKKKEAASAAKAAEMDLKKAKRGNQKAKKVAIKKTAK
ncbi:hypothetical protein F4814DRAFT_445140 [Daldinia grandis]|nr:hypothetical protein F4814DRAFT_445140 [Daldinia grandis]